MTFIEVKCTCSQIMRYACTNNTNYRIPHFAIWYLTQQIDFETSFMYKIKDTFD